jgi:hypothetical protein
VLLAWLAKGNELTGTHSYLPGHHHTARPLLASEKKEEKKPARREGMQLRAACRCRDSRRTASRPGKSTRNGRPPNTAMASTKDRDRKMKVMFFIWLLYVSCMCVWVQCKEGTVYMHICAKQKAGQGCD